MLVLAPKDGLGMRLVRIKSPHNLHAFGPVSSVSGIPWIYPWGGSISISDSLFFLGALVLVGGTLFLKTLTYTLFVNQPELVTARSAKSLRL